MNEPAYPFIASADALDYSFESVSDQKTIRKSILFTVFDNNALLYNLALGDLQEDGLLDDSAISDNRDMNRVIATVVKAMMIFFDTYPEKLVYFQGSDKQGIRTRLYRILLAREIEEVKNLFIVYGRRSDNGIENFISGQTYIGFIFQRKR